MNNCICIFSAQYPPHMGGVEKFSKKLAEELLLMGQEVVVVTNAIDEIPGIVRSNGLTVFRLPCFPMMSGRMPVPKLNYDFFKLSRELQKFSFDGVLVNTRFYFHSLFGMRIARKNGLQPVVLDHGSDYITLNNSVLDFMIRIYERSITYLGKVLYSPAYYGISSRSALWLKNFNISALGVIGNAIDIDEYLCAASARNFRREFSIEDNRSLVTFVGRFVPEKGISQLLKAASSPVLIERNVSFLFCGDGPLKHAIENAGENVIYVGRLSESDVAALLLQSNILCLPSRSEGFSTCLLEAAACSTPILATRVGGADEIIIDRQHGRLLRNDSAESICEGILDMLNDPAGLEDMGRNAHTLVREEYDWHSVAIRVLSAFHDSEIK